MINFYGAYTASVMSLCSFARHPSPAHHLYTEPRHLRTGFGKLEGPLRRRLSQCDVSAWWTTT